MKKLKGITPFQLSSLLRRETDPKCAFQLFLNPNSDPSPNPKPFPYSLLSYDLIITKLGKAKLLDELEQILSKLKLETRFTPTEIIFCNIITFYCRARLPDKALQSDLDGAQKMFDEMRKRGLKPTAVTFSTLIAGLCTNLKLQEAFKLKRDMTKIYKVTPNVHVYTSLIRGLCEVKDLSLAFELKNEMLERNIKLDSAIYTTLISGLFKVGRKDELHELLEEMKKAGCHPETETYNALIAGFCGEKQFDLALEFLHEMELQGRKPDVISYNVLIRAYCEEGKFRDAIDLFEDMPRRGLKPDVVSYRILVHGLFNGMQLNEAAFILDEMTFKGYAPYPSTIDKFIRLLHKEGNLELFFEVLSSLARGNFINVDSWTLAITTIFRKGEQLNLEDLFDVLTTSYAEYP
ncbi:hypothetical protein Cgig2_002893 [Carnegiea gigantea]|uniref:PROP1-like PPR domain-containing protein n=1 Tax=Carnegiea gigantea TaxID=171969 RepID=A0A9Q1QM96_9CARY|nr:hypothetical protein Cgig2_002893 [Carnegiea gigantea]